MKMKNRCPDCGVRYTSEEELALHECPEPVVPSMDDDGHKVG